MELTLSPWMPEIRGTWSLDPARSFVSFSVMDRGISRICGRFGEITGHLEAGGAPGADPVVALGVQAGSINTGHLLRDSRLRSGLLLDAARYPEIAFTGTRAVPSGPGRCRIQGVLALRGTERPLGMRATIRRAPADAAGAERLGLRAKARVDRRMFGLGWHGEHPAVCAGLGRQVTVTVEAQFVPEAGLHRVA
jgi:polyisoprenoid-binding protein YceI